MSKSLKRLERANAIRSKEQAEKVTEKAKQKEAERLVKVEVARKKRETRKWTDKAGVEKYTNKNENKNKKDKAHKYVIELRKIGLSYRKIAAKVGYSHQGIHLFIKRISGGGVKR